MSTYWNHLGALQKILMPKMSGWQLVVHATLDLRVMSSSVPHPLLGIELT